MRLIIDIDEDVRVAITRVGLLRISDEMQKKVDKAIQHGIPIPDNATVCDIEQIRDEIEQITDTMGVSYNQYVSKIDVLQIIDKYRKD